MRQRQERDHDVAAVRFLVAELEQRGTDIGHDVLVRQHDAFGVSGRSRSVANGGQVVWSRGLKDKQRHRQKNVQGKQSSGALRQRRAGRLTNSFCGDEAPIFSTRSKLIISMPLRLASSMVVLETRLMWTSVLRQAGGSLSSDTHLSSESQITSWISAVVNHHRVRQTAATTAPEHSHTLVNDVLAGFGSECVVQRHDDHGEGEDGVLAQHPFGAVLTIDADEGGRAGSQTHRHQSRAEVADPEQRLLVPHPLILLAVGFPPSQTGAIV